MTIEEKRQKLDEFCDKHSSCLDCVLGGEKCRCGRGAHFRFEVGDSGYMTDEEIIAAYELAFPGTEGDSIFIMGDKDGGMAVTNTGYEFWQDGEAKIKLECTDPTPVIKDSGTRREFDTGAVRDIQEGKGRCDLMPLDVVADYLTIDGNPNVILSDMYLFQISGDWGHLVRALDAFNEYHWHNNKTLFLEVAIHFEEGAKKYGENNWQKGIPVRCYIDSAVRHYLKWLRGDMDEPHDRAFCWNILCAIWTCKHKPELNAYAVTKTEVPTPCGNTCVSCGAPIPEGWQFCNTCWENANGG